MNGKPLYIIFKWSIIIIVLKLVGSGLFYGLDYEMIEDVIK